MAFQSSILEWNNYILILIANLVLSVCKIVVSLHLMNKTVFISLELPGADALYDIYLY
jgi:hypothetical protein